MIKKFMLSVVLLGANLSLAGVGSLIVDFKELSAILKNSSIVTDARYAKMQLLNNSFKAVEANDATVGMRSAFTNGVDNRMGMFNIGLEGSTSRGGFNNATLFVGASAISRSGGSIKAEEEIAKLIEKTLTETRKTLKLESTSYSRKTLFIDGERIDTNLVTMSMGNMTAEQAETIIKSVTDLRNRIELEGLEAVKKSMNKPSTIDNSGNW